MIRSLAILAAGLMASGCAYTRVSGKDAAGAEWHMTRIAVIQRNDIGAADLAHGTVTAYKGAADAETAGAVVGAAIKAAVVP